MKYRTIVADPPWAYDEGWPSDNPLRIPKGAIFESQRSAMKYATMDVAQIVALPVEGLAERNAHLYLWTTNRYLRDAFQVMEAWGFRFGQLLVWAKTPMGKGPGGAFAQNAEYVLFGRRGSLRHMEKMDSVWFNWPRTAKHSVKPDAFLDLVERISPEPRIELFARRARFGWDYWGNESLGTAEMPEPVESVRADHG